MRIVRFPTSRWSAWRAAVGLSVVLWCAQSAAQQTAPGGAVTSVLTYRECETSLSTDSIPFQNQAAAFAKEPDLGQRSVERGLLKLGGAHEQLPFVWDFGQNRLYLDLNRNRDLTDDGPAISATQPDQRSWPGGWYNQRFAKVQLKGSVGGAPRPSLLDLEFFRYGERQTRVTAYARSLWEGKLVLPSGEWQVGRFERFGDRPASAEASHLLVRPWEEHQRPLNADSGSLDFVPWPKLVYFGGETFKVTVTFGTEADPQACKLAWQKQAVDLGELKLTGKFIHRLVLYGNSTTAILTAPGESARVPVGEYHHYQVALKGVGADAVLSLSSASASSRRVEIASGQPATLAAGGPLTNTVAISRRGRFLNLNYRLTGGGGMDYTLNGTRKQPEFVVYRGDSKVAEGKFEFG